MFDPTKYLIPVQGGRKYLPVQARLIWFHEAHPDWSIETSPVHIDYEKEFAVFSAAIKDETGRTMATATKMENVRGFGDWLEKAECVPLDTEILTSAGWKTYDQVRIGEMVLAFDHEKDATHWVPLQRASVYDEAPVVRMYNGWGFDAVCTPEHTWAIRYSAAFNDKSYEYRKLRQTMELKSGNQIITACQAPSGNSRVSVEQASIMGWLLTDGSIRRAAGDSESMRGIIYQSKSPQVAMIDDLLADVPHLRRTKKAGVSHIPQGVGYCRESIRWHIRSEYITKLLADFGICDYTQVDEAVPQMTAEAREAMLGAMLLADGDKKQTFGKKRKPWVMKTFALLCALQGISLGKIRFSTVGDVPLQRVKRTRLTHVSNLVTEDAGKTSVWCPTTEYGTWYARFSNGFTTITGNTGAIGRALGLCGFGTQFAPDLDENNNSHEPQRSRNGYQDNRDRYQRNTERQVDQHTGEITESRPQSNGTERKALAGKIWGWLKDQDKFVYDDMMAFLSDRGWASKVYDLTMEQLQDFDAHIVSVTSPAAQTEAEPGRAPIPIATPAPATAAPAPAARYSSPRSFQSPAHQSTIADFDDESDPFAEA